MILTPAEQRKKINDKISYVMNQEGVILYAMLSRCLLSKHLHGYGYAMQNEIGGLESLESFGVYRLSSIINRLRKRGFNIITTMRDVSHGNKAAFYHIPPPVLEDEIEAFDFVFGSPISSARFVEAKDGDYWSSANARAKVIENILKNQTLRHDPSLRFMFESLKAKNP